jgi:cyanophycinase
MMKIFLPAFVFFLFFAPKSTSQSYEYIRTGASEAAHSKYQFGAALMGGGSDLDDAFRWLCAKSGGGDFLILRAAGGDDYNPYVKGLCRPNSVATLIIPDRNSAQDPRVAEIIRSAQAIFIAGGDQARYVNYWKGTPVQDAINADIAEGKPIGGTSAGLAVLGEFIYGALQDKENDNDLTSEEVLRNPYFNRVTLARDFSHVPLLRNVLTDSHFAKRHRLGRSLGFLARIIQDGWSEHPREIAIDEKSAVLVEAGGSAKVVGPGKGAYFMEATEKPELCAPGKPLTIRGITQYHAPTGASFDLKTWTGNGGESYVVAVVEGKIVSQPSSKVHQDIVVKE